MTSSHRSVCASSPTKRPQAKVARPRAEAASSYRTDSLMRLKRMQKQGGLMGIVPICRPRSDKLGQCRFTNDDEACPRTGQVIPQRMRSVMERVEYGFA